MLNMENLPQNFPKKPESPDELKENKERERTKTIEIKVGEQTYQLEAESYNFEYPKNIQEETGIIGYERTIISQESLSSVVDEKDFYQLIVNKILPVLSGGEYPKRSFNHMYSWYSNPETQSRHKDYFKQDFFLGKIYDLKKIKQESGSKSYPFSSAKTTTEDFSRTHANISIYDQETEKRITYDESISIGDVLKFEDQIKKGDVYATTTFGGLNLSAGDFFEQYAPDFTKEICLGFSFKLDNFMHEYFEKTFYIYAQKNESNPKINNGFVETAVFLLINSIYDNKPQTSGYMSETEINYLNSILEENIDRKLSDEEITQINSKLIIRKHVSRTGYGILESKLPIFIGHKELPQLSWGHATYANFMSEKGFNFFKFKHAEHLPIKQEENTTDSPHTTF